ncbi:MAG: GNAT family N-acetyltransferase [Clostridium sp.]|nr:GNAT family N-acetyltransferase [Clostridium sp.]
MKLADGSTIIAKPYRDEDAEEIVNLIIRNFREVNVKDYGEDAIEALTATHDVKWFRGVAEYASVYVFWHEDRIVGVGSIASFWGSPTESILLTVFVLPEFHRQGIGSYIVDTLESDPLFLRAERIEIPASITAVEFYRKKGYDYKNGIRELDDEQHYRLEKFRKLN